jgi:hypothetical protein
MRPAASGVWLIDAKNYTGLVQRRDEGGFFKTTYHLYVGGRDRTKIVDGSAGRSRQSVRSWAWGNGLTLGVGLGRRRTSWTKVIRHAAVGLTNCCGYYALLVRSLSDRYECRSKLSTAPTWKLCSVEKVSSVPPVEAETNASRFTRRSDVRIR